MYEVISYDIGTSRHQYSAISICVSSDVVITLRQKLSLSAASAAGLNSAAGGWIVKAIDLGGHQINAPLVEFPLEGPPELIAFADKQFERLMERYRRTRTRLVNLPMDHWDAVLAAVGMAGPISTLERLSEQLKDV